MSYLARLPQGITRFRGFKPGPVDVETYEGAPYIEHMAWVMADYWERHEEIERAMAIALYGRPKSVVWNVTAQ